MLGVQCIQYMECMVLKLGIQMYIKIYTEQAQLMAIPHKNMFHCMHL